MFNYYYDSRKDWDGIFNNPLYVAYIMNMFKVRLY